MSEQTAVLDVLIVGAGLSGIGMACHLRKSCPDKRFEIVERRQNVGGTWDLFRYPGIRSDADMFTFGFAFRPWMDAKVLADGALIRNYIKDTAQEYGVFEHIRFGHSVVHASWSSAQRCWQVQVRDDEHAELRVVQCRFLIMGTGYYDYDAGYQPDFPGRENFQGQFVHPQHWPEDLDYSNKRVVVIGSGATAVTLVPSMADKVAHITMLQRSPTYIMSLPATDKVSMFLRKFLPANWVHWLARRRNIFLTRLVYKASQRWPQRMRKFYLNGVRKALGPDYDMRHFTPDYGPWDQRLCVVPDGDLFAAIRSGKASVATDHIDHFTADGIRLKSGEELKADIVISATGLNLRLLGGATLDVDGETRDPGQVMSYKAVLIQDVPNFAAIYGYTNAPWTLKSDLASAYLCRLLNYMDAHGHAVVVPRDEQGCMAQGSVMDSLSSGYVRRGAGALPRQGQKYPWRVLNHYEKDRQMLLKDPIEDAALHFSV